MTRSRLLLVSPGFPPARGGIERTAGELAAGLGRRHELLVVAGRPHDDGAAPVAGLRLHWTPNDPPYGRQATGALNAHTIRLGLRYRPDLVLCLHIRAMPAVRALQRATGVRAVLVVHAKEMAEQRHLGRAAARWADGVVTVSTFSRELAIAAGAVPQRTTIINPGVTLPAAPPVSVDQRPGPLTVIAVARMADRHKGHDVLIEAIARLRRRGREVPTLLVGDGPLRPGLERLAAERGVPDLITFTGAVSDDELRNRLRAAHIFCLPTRLAPAFAAGEGFGIAFVEAAAYGLPVVAGRVPGVVDAVADGVNGLLVAPDDPDAIAAALDRLAADPHLAARLGAAGQERAAQLGLARGRGPLRFLVRAGERAAPAPWTRR